MSKKRIIILALAFALIFTVVFTGCTARKPMYTPVPKRTVVTPQYTERTDGNVSYRTTPNANVPYTPNPTLPNTYNNMGTPTTQTDNIARNCKNVQGVNNATVVLSGKTAYVGIDVTGNTTNKNISNIKKLVADKVRATDKNITTVYVSADMDFMNRLRNIGNSVRNGKPVQGFTTELNDMVRRITPERK